MAAQVFERFVERGAEVLDEIADVFDDLVGAEPALQVRDLRQRLGSAVRFFTTAWISMIARAELPCFALAICAAIALSELTAAARRVRHASAAAASCAAPFCSAACTL